MKTILVSMICPEKPGVKNSRWMYTDGHNITITDKKSMLVAFSTMGKLDTDYRTVYVDAAEGHRRLRNEMS